VVSRHQIAWSIVREETVAQQVKWVRMAPSAAAAVGIIYLVGCDVERFSLH
jgi:hypothetical protein